MENITSLTKGKLNRQLICLLFSLIISLSGFSQNVGINSTGASPNPSAGLDVDFPNKGLLIPRVALTGTANFAPLLAHVAGMIVYNTATVSDVIPGFYYNNGTKWVAGFPAGNAIGNMLYWNGTDWVLIPAGSPGQYLQVSGTNLPFWGALVTPVATIITTAANAIDSISAKSGANITSDGGSPILTRGVCWNTITGPTIANSKTTDGSGIGVYVSSLTGLLPVTTYYVRAYAINSTSVNYGNEISFTTNPELPTLTATTAATAITGTTATSGGMVTKTGGAPIIERGICYATTANPTIANTKVIDPSPGLGVFTSNLTGLTGYTTYYVRAYATNSVGTAYGTQISFRTLTIPPTLVTVAASAVTGASAVSGASMSWNGGGYSNYQNYGVAYATTPGAASPTFVATNTSNGSVNPAVPIAPWVTTLTGLAANTTYYIRSYLMLYPSGTGPWITVFGNELSFTTSGPTAPIVASTSAITNISDRAATSGGAITSDGGSAITAKGVCWGTSAAPTLGASNFTNNGTGTAAFSSNITGLTGSTLYYVRAYATNAIGTSYGPADVTFTTWAPAPYTIGQNLGWGYCASVDATGGGYLVSYDIFPTSPATTFVWGCNGVHVAVGTALGTGKTNTDLIIATCGANTAAGAARAYNGGGFTDWFLPSNSEFQIVASSYTLFGFSGGYTSYFTSSEYGTNYAYASSFFYTGSQAYASGSVRIGDTYTHAIRAMRAFTGFSAPTISTATVVNITSTGATSGGTIGSDGGAAVTARGVCWNTSTGPTTANSKTVDGTGIGTFTSTITGLTPGVTYYIRAYATNSVGTNYGNELSFTPTAPVIPTLTTDVISALTATTATSGGNITADGGALLTAYGVVWNTATAPTITTNAGITNDFAATGPFPLAFVSSVTGLTPGTTYYLRAYATTSAGTSYGNEVSFTPLDLPTVTTSPMGSLIGAIAAAGGSVDSEGGAAVTAFGVCWSTTTGPTVTTNLGITNDLAFPITGLTPYIYNSTVTGLTIGTTYYVRAYATNSFGTGYGTEISFVAAAATLGQNVIINGLAAVVFSVDGTGLHGLIADLYGWGTADWGCTGTLVGASGTTVGTGMANTTSIIASNTLVGCISGAPIGAFAPEVTKFDGPDWYLPSKDEMDLLWTNRGVDASGILDTNLSAAIGGVDPYFWCSSEVDAGNAWFFDGTVWSNATGTFGTKASLNNVWAIRTF